MITLPPESADSEQTKGGTMSTHLDLIVQLEAENRRMKVRAEKAEAEAKAHFATLTKERQGRMIAEAEVERLLDALRHLVDAQNGPPLLGEPHERFWGEAMKKAAAAMAGKFAEELCEEEAPHE